MKKANSADLAIDLAKAISALPRPLTHRITALAELLQSESAANRLLSEALLGLATEKLRSGSGDAYKVIDTLIIQLSDQRATKIGAAKTRDASPVCFNEQVVPIVKRQT